MWFNDGLWWANLWDTASSDFHIFRFNASTSSWVDTGVATDTRANTHHDVLWDGTTLYVASYRFVNDGLPAEPNFPTTMRRYSYNSTSKTYSLRGSTNINNHRVEALTIDKDSTGRVWATWQQGNRIYLNVTGTDGATWGTPFPHPAALSNVSVDDTSAVIAFGPGKIGVMWSRQVGDATDGMYWSYHVDGAANTAWTAPVAAVNGQRSGDDHMNLKWLDSSGGRVFAAIKTSFTSASQPLIQLLALNNTTSTWSAHTIATVAECPNRVIVLIDESTQRLRTFATYPKPSGTTNAGVCTTSGGAIYEKSTPLSDISFTTTKTARIVDADQYVHNVTSTKQNLNSAARGTANSGVLLLADVNATSRYWHSYDPAAAGGGGGGDTTAPDTSITSAPPATTTSTSASFAFTSTEANSTFQCSLDGAPRVACTSPRAYTGLSTGSHTFSVWGTDAAGNTDSTPATHAWSVGSGGGTTETVTLTATADSYVSSGTPTTNFGASTVLGVDSSPVEATYFKFDLSAYAGRTLQSATLQLRSAGSGSTGTQNVKVASDAWTETGVTYNSGRPTLGASIGTLGPTTTNTTYNVPLTVSGLTGELGQQLSLALDSSSSDGLDLNSKEAGSTAAPKLVLTVSGTGTGGGGGGGDTTAPETSITSGPADTTTSTSASFAFTSTEANSTFQCSLDGAPRVACTSPQTYTGLSTGSHTFNVWATDAAGNTDATAATQTWSVGSGGGTTETVTLTATADSYVSSGATGTNFGTSTVLGVDNSPIEASYFKFDLSAYAGRTVQSATLQLRSAGSGSTGAQNVKLLATGADENWTETGITYTNRPALGTTSIGTLGPTTTNTNYSVPLTVSGLNGELGGDLTLGLDSSSSDGLDLNSKEAGSTAAPKLVLTVSG